MVSSSLLYSIVILVLLYYYYYYHYYYYYYNYYYYTILRVFTPALVDGFSLKSSWLQVSRTLLSILTDLSNAIVWMVPTYLLIFLSDGDAQVILKSWGMWSTSLLPLLLGLLRPYWIVLNRTIFIFSCM